MPAFLLEKKIYFFSFSSFVVEGLLLGGSVTFLSAFCFAAFIFESSVSLAYISTSLSVDLIQCLSECKPLPERKVRM